MWKKKKNFVDILIYTSKATSFDMRNMVDITYNFTTRNPKKNDKHLKNMFVDASWNTFNIFNALNCNLKQSAGSVLFKMLFIELQRYFFFQEKIKLFLFVDLLDLLSKHFLFLLLLQRLSWLHWIQSDNLGTNLFSLIHTMMIEVHFNYLLFQIKF